MSREWLFSTLLDNPDLGVEVGDRIYQSSSISEIPAVKPYILYRFGTSAPALVGDDGVTKRVQPIQLFVHDNPGDYARIDRILVLIRATLEGQQSAEVTRCQWLEESEDLRDDEMFTITRFARYQLIH